jgi:hypothetical protein
MSAYVPALIWILSAFLCAWIAKARQIRPNALWAIVVVILGPLAIPLVFLARPRESQHAD